MDETFIQERSQASFNVSSLIDWRNGSAYNTELNNIVDMIIQRDPMIMKKRFFDLTEKENRRKTMQQIRRYVALIGSMKNPDLRKAFSSRMEVYDSTTSMRIYVHETLFNETIATQGSDEQYAKYKDDIKAWRIIGCFAMTELGHSSYLRGLETVAVYDKEYREFVLTSPTVTATKWWIGMSGQSATHTVALANLVVDGENKGLNWFVVPLRDRETGELLPGVTCGHLGKKFGRDGLDNGWIQFTNVRLPHDAMLNRWSFLTPEGEFYPPPNPAIAYATLIGERILAMAGCQSHVTPILVTSVRYALMRRQGPEQKQIMDFQSHQMLLIPIISTLYLTGSVFRKLMSDWTSLLTPESIQDGSFLAQAQDFHAISAGSKAWIGWWGAEALETVRRSMGGHAYSAYNNIAYMIGSYGVITTGGGDNIVLAQQCASFLINAYNRIRQNKPVGFSVSFLTKKIAPTVIKRGSDLRDLRFLVNAFQWLSAEVLNQVSGLVQSSINSGLSKDEAMKEHMMECITASRPFTIQFQLQTYENEIAKVTDPELFNIVQKLGILTGIQYMKDLSELFLEYGYLDKISLQLIRKELKTLCKELRPEVLSLVDGFGLPDYVVKSPLGTYSGINMYDNYLKTIQEAPEQGVAEYWNDEVAPLVRPKY
jgi:acyl-CoA oxidase